MPHGVAYIWKSYHHDRSHCSFWLMCSITRCVCFTINSPPRVAYMRQWIGSALVQIMACRLFGAKPLSKPMLGYCQLDPQEQTWVIFFIKSKTFHSSKCSWKSRGRWVKTTMYFRKAGHFLSRVKMGNTCANPMSNLASFITHRKYDGASNCNFNNIYIYILFSSQSHTYKIKQDGYKRC